MKTKQLLFIAATLAASFIAQQANAKIWRVNNLSNYIVGSKYGENLGGTPTNPVFAQISNAMSSLLVSPVAGDTLHVEGTNIVYAATTVTKKLIIIGTGYFLNENPNVSNSVMETETSYFTFNAGSEGSQLIGVHVSNGNGIGINVSNITIKRCRIDFDISLTFNIMDIFILENYFSNPSNSASGAISPNGNGFPSNFIFNNNICQRTLLLSAGTTIFNAEQINNNVFDCPPLSALPSIKFNATECRNNIIKSTNIIVAVNGSNTNFTNNTSAATSQLLGTDASNVNAVNITTLFSPLGTSDGKYVLNPASADNILGFDGTQRGVFGGAAVTDRYTLSGLAAIPVIYSVTTSGVGSTSLTVTVKARTIK